MVGSQGCGNGKPEVCLVLDVIRLSEWQRNQTITKEGRNWWAGEEEGKKK